MIQIPNFPHYQITRDGRIFSSHRKNLKELKQMSNKGYLCVDLREDGKSHFCLVHRLVAITYLPNPFNLPLVCHKNDIRHDNRVENLFWGTESDNMKDMISKGRGINSANSPRKPVIIDNVEFPSIKAAADHFGVLGETIRKRILRHHPGYSFK